MLENSVLELSYEVFTEKESKSVAAAISRYSLKANSGLIGERIATVFWRKTSILRQLREMDGKKNMLE